MFLYYFAKIKSPTVKEDIMDNRQTGYGRKAKKSTVIVSAIILLLSVSLFFGIYLAPRQTKEVYAQANLSAPSEVESITIALNQDATNKHGVTGIYTSMSLQDLIARGYFLITAHYADKTEVIDSGYTDFDIAYAKVGDPSSNLAFGENEIKFVLKKKPEVKTSFSVTAQQVSETSVKAEYDMDEEGNFLQDGKPQYIYDVNGLDKVSTYIKVYRMNNDGTKVSDTPLDYNTEYTLSATLAGGKLVAGKNTVTVNYQGRTTSFVLNVVARDIVSLSVEVKEGVTLHNYDIPGNIKSALEVTATYNNGDVEPFTGYTFASEDCTYKDYDLYAGIGANTTGKIRRVVCVENKAKETIVSDPIDISIEVENPTSIIVLDATGNIQNSNFTSGSKFDLSMLSENNVIVNVTFGSAQKYGHGSYLDGRFSVVYCTAEGTETEDTAFNRSHTGIKIKYTENGVSVTSSFIKIGKVVPKTIQEPAFESKSFTYDGTEHSFDVTNFDSEAVKLLVSVGEEEYTVRVEDGKAVIYSGDAAIQDAPFTASFADKTMTLGVKNVGTYAIQAALNDTDNFIWETWNDTAAHDIGNIQVAPGTYDFSVSFRENKFNYGAKYVFDAYDGSSPLKVDLSRAPQEIQQAFQEKTLKFRYTYYSSDNLTSPLEGKPVAVGTYFVSVTIEKHINYNETTSVLSQGQFYIVKIGNVLENAEISFTASGDKNYTYDDTLFSPSFMADGNFSPYIKTNLAGISGFNGGLSGDYSVNYKGTANDGTKVDFTVTYTFAAGKWTASTAEDGAYYPKLAGNYTLTLTVAATDDYESTSKTLEFTVNRKQLSAVITAGDNDFTYNGTEQTYNPVIAAEDQELVAVSDNTGKDADSYSARVSLNDANNYTWAAGQTASGQDPLEFSFTIARRQLSDPTLQAGEGSFDEGNTFVYSGDHFYVKVVDSPEIVSGETAYNVKGAGADAKQINVGTFNVTFTLTDNYEWINGGTDVKTLTWGITPKPIARPTSADEVLTYNGETQYVTVKGETQQNAVQYAFSGDYSATNAGSYTVTLTPTANYKWSDGEERDAIFVPWVIHKQGIDKSAATAVLTDKNTEYDGTEQTWDLSALADQLTVSADNGASVVGQSVSAKDAKTYTVTVSINDKNNYKWSGEEDAAEAEDLTATWKIAPAALNVTWTGDSFTYNAEAQSPEYEVTGWKGDDENNGGYTLTLSIEGEKATKGNAVNAGDYTAKLMLSTSGNMNYYFTAGSEDTVESTHAFTIKQATLTITWTDGINTVVYNGEEQTPAFTVSGWWGTDEDEYGDKVTAVNPKTHAGSYSDLQFTITGTENYTLDYAAATSYSILKKELTPSWSATKFVYNAKAQSPVVTLSGFVGSEKDNYTVSYALSVKEGSVLTDSQAINAGSYSVTATLSRTDGIMDYYISSTDKVAVTADFVIDKYTIDLYGDNGIFKERQYEATGDAIDVVFTVAQINGTAIGEIFTVTYADTKPSAAQDDPYTVTLKLTDAAKGNYCWDEENLYNESMSIYKGKDTLLEDGVSVAAVYWITALQYQLEISFEGNTANKWTYGDTAPNIIVTATGENAPESLAGFEITYQYFKGTSTGDGSSLGDQMPTNAGKYTLRVTVKGNGTYASVENIIVFTIEQKEVTANLVVDNGTYGKWEKAVAENVSGSIGSEVTAADFVFTYYVKNAEGGFDIIEEPFHAGAYKVVMTLSAGKSNYFFTEKSQEFTIEKAEITVTLQGFADIRYGDVNPASGYTLVDNAKITAGGLLSEETLASIGLDGTFATTYTQGGGITNGVKYEVYLSAYHEDIAALADYVVTIVRGELKVLPKTISLTVTDSNGTEFLGGTYNGSPYGIKVAANDLYEGNDALIKVTYGGRLMNGTEYSSEVMPVNAGEYTYDVTIGNENYMLDKEYSGGFTVEKCQAKVTWTENNFTYNGNDQRAAVTASYQGGALSVNAPVGGFKDYSADAYTFTATFKTDIEKNNYYFSAAEEVTTQKGYFMQRAAAEITVKDGSVVYGDAFDGFGYTANLQNSETLESISFFDTYKYATDYAVGNAVGGYNIYFAKDGSPLTDGGSFDFGNYTFTLHYGALTVTPREITVSFTVPDGAVFSGNANELTGVTFNNLYNDVSPEAVIVYAAAGGNEVVDGKAVHQGKYSYALTIANGNYLLTGLTVPVTGAVFADGEVSGTFTVTKKTVSAEWSAAKSYTYTAQNQKESVTAQYTAVTDEKIALAVTFEHNDTKSTEFTAAGEYTLTASFAGGG